jgi:hypothetical protein
MEYINQGASALNNGIDSIVRYSSENGVAIGFLLVIAYFVRSSGKSVSYDRHEMEWNGMEWNGMGRTLVCLCIDIILSSSRRRFPRFH